MKRYCPHIECPHYKGADTQCDEKRVPGLYNRKIEEQDGKIFVHAEVDISGDIKMIRKRWHCGLQHFQRI